MMESPTRQHHENDTDIGLIWRPKWFLITRFIAVFGVCSVLVVARFIFRITTIDYHALWMLALTLLTFNILYVVYYMSGRLNPSLPAPIIEKRLTFFTQIQINADLVILTYMLHFSGGATNPFIIYYFFHTIIASILLKRLAAYIEATVAVVLFSGMALFEGYAVIAHYNLFCPGYHTQPIFIFGMIAAISSGLYIAVYMASSIMERLRSHQVDLERALEEQKRLEEEKSRFLDVVAHDLKSPLAAIETMVTSSLAVHGDTIPPDIKKIMYRIPERTRELLRFIQDLLEFSRITKLDASETVFKQLNFLPIVAATVEMYMGQALEKNINVSFHSDPGIPPILGNQDHLERMVGNLVSNAVRYTRENGSVTVKISAESQYVVLTVADTGIGIPEQALPHIFSDFFRADNAKKFSSSGTGLGMSITKAIVEQHGGTISVTSEEGEGTMFTVKLPASAS